LGVVLRRVLVRVVALGQFDVEDLARHGRPARRRLALGVEPVVETVGEGGAADEVVDTVQFDDLVDVFD
jgi:hypothetical protein